MVCERVRERVVCERGGIERGVRGEGESGV